MYMVHTFKHYCMPSVDGIPGQSCVITHCTAGPLLRKNEVIPLEIPEFKLFPMILMSIPSSNSWHNGKFSRTASETPAWN